MCIYAVDETSKSPKSTQFGGLGNVVILLWAICPPTIFFFRINCLSDPFGLSDHLSITVLPNIRQKSQAQSKIIQTRDKRPSRVASLGRYLLDFPWNAVLSENESCDDKLAAVTQIVNYGLDAIMPVRSVKVHQTDRPFAKC